MKGRKNGGFSLIELIIVIAILAVLGGVIIVIAGDPGKYKVKQYAELLDSFMRKNRTDAMARNSICGFCLYQRDGQYFVESYGERKTGSSGMEYQTVEIRELGSQSGVEIEISKKDGSASQILEDNAGDNLTSYFRVKYAAATGAVEDVIVDGTSRKDYVRITMSKGVNQRWIEINPVTGKNSKN